MILLPKKHYEKCKCVSEYKQTQTQKRKVKCGMGIFQLDNPLPPDLPIVIRKYGLYIHIAGNTHLLRCL